MTNEPRRKEERAPMRDDERAPSDAQFRKQLPATEDELRERER